jgi:hypothetical protein
MNNTISIVAIILFITLCITLHIYFDLASKMQKFQYERLKHVVNLQNDIKIESEKLLEKEICNEKLQTCTSQLDVNTNVLNEIRNALHSATDKN